MENLARLAFKSEDTFGRALSIHDRDFSLYDWMDPFNVDLIKIEYSKALRRLRGKTQVISGLRSIHIRDRLIHSMEVSAIATQIGHRLGLNVPLIQASALGHELGHVVFGHLGETFIAERLGEDFRHERFVIFVLEMIERDGNGLNLSYETLHAIRNHSRGSGRMLKNGASLEDDVIMFSDKLSYIFSDYNDVKRTNLSGLIVPDELMKLGNNQTERLYNCARALCLESLEKGLISFEESNEAKSFYIVRDFMYNEVYHKINRQHLKDVLAKVYDLMFRYFKDNRLACLALALMAEEGVVVIGEMIGKFSDDFILEKMHNTANFAVAEFLPKIPEWAALDFCNSDRFLDKKNFGKISKMELFSR